MSRDRRDPWNGPIRRPESGSQLEVVPYLEDAAINVMHDATHVSSFTLPLEPVKLGCRVTNVEVSRSDGGSIPLAIDGSPGRAGTSYLLPTGLSRTVPGTEAPLGTMPLNVDTLTMVALSLYSTPQYAGFEGVLDDRGIAQGINAFDAGQLPPILEGMDLSFVGLSFDGDHTVALSAASRTAGLP